MSIKSFNCFLIVELSRKVFSLCELPAVCEIFFPFGSRCDRTLMCCFGIIVKCRCDRRENELVSRANWSNSRQRSCVGHGDTHNSVRHAKRSSHLGFPGMGLCGGLRGCSGVELSWLEVLEFVILKWNLSVPKEINYPRFHKVSLSSNRF